MPQVHVIEPIYSHEPAKLRVCAYARVSSDSADQLNSFAAQVRYYTNLIAGNEDWMLVDIYATAASPAPAPPSEPSSGA